MADNLRSCLAKLWSKQSKNDWFQLNQLAFHFFGKGGPAEAQRAGMLKALNPTYFEDQYHRKHSPVRVLWERVKADFPGPPWGTAPAAGSSPPSSLGDRLEAALDDEKKHSFAHWNKHPVFVTGLRELTSGPVYGHAYECELENADEGSGGALLEGARVLVKRAGSYGTEFGGEMAKAVLLLYDALDWKMILEFDGPPPFRAHERLAVFPDLSALIDSFRKHVRAYDTNPLCQFLVGGTGNLPSMPPVTIDGADLSPEQLQFLQLSAANPVTFLWGPPGTGKTHTLAALIASFALSGERVLGVAISNAAVDELALDVHDRLVRGTRGQELLKAGRVMRFGHPGRRLLAMPELFPQREAAQKLRRELEKLMDTQKAEKDHAKRARLTQDITRCRKALGEITSQHLAQATIVLTTISQTAISDPLRSSPSFGTVVCDEASMANLSHIFPAASLGRHRLVIAGDPRQLGPVVIATSDVAKRHLKMSVFEARGNGTLGKEHPQVQLTRQRRMVPGIGDLVSRTFYEGKLESHESVSHPDRGHGLKWLPADRHVLLVRHIGQVERTDSGSKRNESTARFIVDLLKRLVLAAPATTEPYSIGLIAPYRAQVGFFRRFVVELERELSSRQSAVAALKQVRVGTVHAFQGGEADIIVCDLVDCRPDKPGMLYWNDEGNRLVNVALSRARRLVLLVGDDQAFVGHQAVQRLGSVLAELTRRGHVMTSEALLRRMEAGP